MLFLLVLHCLSIAFALQPQPIVPAIRSSGNNRRDAAVIISNESYQKFPQVIYAANDGSAAKDFFLQTMRMSKSRVMFKENVKRKKILKLISKMSRKVQKNGALWVYFVGHGYTMANGERAILPADARDKNFESYPIAINEIINIARKKTKARRIVIVVDAGFGNIGRDGLDVYGDKKPHKANTLPYNDHKTIVWIPSTGPQAAPTFPLSQNGLFSYLVLGSLRGWADGETDGHTDKRLTLEETQQYVANKMVQLGLPLKPSVMPLEQAKNWVIRQGKLEKGPSNKQLRKLSADLRARRFEELAAFIRARASSQWNDTLYLAQKGGPDGEKALKEYLQEFAQATVTIEWSLHVPEVTEAQQLLRNYKRQGNSVRFDPQTCKNLEKMQKTAAAGQLSNQQIACIEGSIRLNRVQTARDKLSRILLRNAQSKKDSAAWEALTRRHLERYDRSDPTMTFAFALHLYKKGKDYYAEALRWADYAMENRQNWQGGQDFVTKSFMLYKLRAELSTTMWIAAESQARKDRNPEARAIAEEARGLAKDYAREWLDYARATKGKTDRAFNMCVSAALSSEFCRE